MAGGSASKPARTVMLLPGTLFATSVVAGFAALLNDVRLTELGGLLTATSVFTGLVFALALEFWSRSIDARSNPTYLDDGGRRLPLFDEMRTYLLITVAVGVLSTATLGALIVFGSDGTELLSTWGSAISITLMLYQLLLVLGAVLRMAQTGYLLRP